MQGTTINGQGLYCVPVHSANINEVIAAADVTNPRVDQVILEIQDNALDASGGNIARTRVLTGTPTSGATLTNRLGAAVLPGNALLLADVLVAASATTLANSVIRDRRKWARGAYQRIVRTAADYTTVSTSLGLVDSVNLQPRVECSGVPVRITLRGRHLNSGANANAFSSFLDGVISEPSATDMFLQYLVGSSADAILSVTWDMLPAAGSHLIGWAWRVNAGTGTLHATTAIPLEFTVEELVRQNTSNNTVTTG